MEERNIPLSVPNLNLDIMPMIQNTIESGWVSTGGKYIKQFEDLIIDYVKINYACGVQSGTAGLHIALQVLGLQENEEVIAPTLTFIAAVNPIRYLHAYPVFIDCDDSLNIDPDKILDFLRNECTFENGIVINKKTNRRIKGITVVHVFGNPADMERIMAIAEKYHLFVLEDATEALGSYYTSGKYAGKYCGTIGDIGVFSFNANKIITTGGGGMIVSNEKAYIDRASFLSFQAKTDPWRFVHDEVGYNYRLTNISAAYGVSQMKHLDEFIEHKTRMYYYYKNEFAKHDLKILNFNSGTKPNYWFYSLLIDAEKYGMDKEELMQKLHDMGIQTRPIWGLIHQQKPYLNCQAYKIEKANYYVKHVLNIPCSSNLKKEDADFVIESIISLKK